MPRPVPKVIEPTVGGPAIRVRPRDPAEIAQEAVQVPQAATPSPAVSPDIVRLGPVALVAIEIVGGPEAPFAAKASLRSPLYTLLEDPLRILVVEVALNPDQHLVSIVDGALECSRVGVVDLVVFGA